MKSGATVTFVWTDLKNIEIPQHDLHVLMLQMSLKDYEYKAWIMVFCQY